MQEKATFTEVYEQYQPLIYGTLKKYSIYKNQEDALQEARLALWEAYANYDPRRGDFSAFAAKYVRGRVMSYLTKQNKHKHTYSFSQLGAEDQEGEIDWKDPLAAEAYLSCELPDILKHAYAPLSAREKIILIEHILHERPLREIAQRESVSLETAKTWKKRALKKLRQTLSPILKNKDI